MGSEGAAAHGARVRFMLASSNTQYLLCIMCFFIVWAFVGQVCVEGHNTDVPRVEMCTAGVRHVDGLPCYESLGGGGLGPSGPHEGARVVFGYTYVHANTVHLKYVGACVHKYIGHETANLLGCGGCRSAHCQ